MLEAGFVVATARILRRVWQIYVAHVFLFTIFLAEISYVATSFENPLYTEEMGIMDFLKQPDVTIVQALLLRFRPVNMDVLPLYIVLMLFLPLILWLMRWKPDVTLALSVLLYAVTWHFDLYLSAYPNGFWAFNPFAWQLLFVFGAWCALGGARRMSRILSSPVTLWICFAYLFAAFCVTLTWYVPQLGHLMPRRIEQWMYPIDKTDLDVLRFAHFLALAAVTVRFLPKDWPGLKSPWLRPLILCGQHSLEIFCLGVFLAFAGHFILAEVSGGAALHAADQPLRNPHHVGIGLDDFVVQALCRQECVAKKAPRQRRSGGRELMRSAGTDPGPDSAGGRWPRRAARAEDAQRRRPKPNVPGLPSELRGSGLSADQRKPAAEGRRCRQERPAAGYSGGGQPVLDHPRIRGERLSRRGCRPSERALPWSRSTYP